MLGPTTISRPPGLSGGGRSPLRLGSLGSRAALASTPALIVVGLLSLAVFAGASRLGGGGGLPQAVAGCTLAVGTNPGPSGVAAVGSGGDTVGLDADQLRNAATIVAVGRQLQVPVRGHLVALATALQESTLRNLNYGDRDSLGLFQQRAAWGSATERTTPATSARFFYTGGKGGQPGLLDISGWQSMTVTQAAQAVQRSAFPDAYAKWEATATRLLGLPVIASAACVTTGSSVGSAVVAAAQRWLGTPYSWGGGDLKGPTIGFGAGAGTIGFDCSSLARYAWYVATNGKVVLPRVATDQAASRPLMPTTVAMVPGDLMFFHDPADPPGIYHHVGIYAGNGAMVHAPHTGAFVSVVQNVLDVPYYRSQFAGFVRPTA